MNEADGQRLFAVSTDFSSFFFHSVVLLSLSLLLFAFFRWRLLLACFFYAGKLSLSFGFTLRSSRDFVDSHIPVVLTNNN
jgi:hypothetical protein